MDPDHGRDLPAAVGPDEIEFRRHTGKLARVLPVLGDVLLPAAEDAGHVMVVVDAQGMVLWRDGPKKIQQHAERLGFTVGANWSECNVGTNAIGTALVLARPVQIYSAEHFVKTHHAWTCAAAPILDPVNGDLLGRGGRQRGRRHRPPEHPGPGRRGGPDGRVVSARGASRRDGCAAGDRRRRCWPAAGSR